MNFSSQFEQYIQAFGQRLKHLVVAHGAAVLATSALVITLIAVTAAIRTGFPDNFMIGARLILAVSLGSLGWFFLVHRRRQIDAGMASLVEQRTPEFEGRVEAYVDTRDETNPMRELLAEETLEIAAQHAPERQVPAREFQQAWSAAAVAAVALLLIAVAGPGNYAYGVRDLWVGWALPGLLPPQSIAVSPGDDGIRMGGTVKVRATMQGFDPAEAWVHASFGDGEWQQVPMTEYEEAFEFTFFSVRQPVEYYVSANNVRSQTYQVHVVDLPNVDNLVLTYNYPEWTGRDPEVHDPGGDIRAIATTEVELQITTDRPMTPGAVFIDDEKVTLDVDGTTATARFTLDTDGQYFVASTVGGERIRLTEDYFITILEDQPPTIAFSRPGRDWSASRIEEVTTRITAEDDFRVDALEVHYSVNGGAWQEVDLDAAGQAVEIDHVFFLEGLGDGEQTPLAPGDLITYYAIAEDREGSARTDMFFVDVQRFDRRYTQSQQAGGGSQGGQQNEVSQRQREIIISTWNLIRERSENDRGNDAYILDNSALLSRLQETLRGQVETLAERAEARQLTMSDEDIAEFVEHLQKAAEVMTPASELLADVDLEQALLPEQEALQHLLAAEAVFNDINVSMQSSRGGGGQAGRDLSEMFELEMDLEKNQYETGNPATPNGPQEQMEDAADELAELARRQEQLAKNRRNSQPTPEQRWQQEMLRRELEELQRQLEQMQSGQQQAQSSQGQSGQQQSGAQSESSQSAEDEPSERELDDLQRRMQSAMRAMNEAEEAMRSSADAESLQRAMDEAQRQLESASDSASEASQRAMQDAVNSLANRATQLHEAQAGMENTLQEAVRNAMQSSAEDGSLDTGLTWQEERQIAEQKRGLLEELQRLQQDAQATAQDVEDAEPGAAEEIREGIGEIRDMEVEARMAVAAAYIEQGEAIYVASSESAVTEAIRELRDRLRSASDMMGPVGAGQPRGEERVQETLAEARELRRTLQDAARQQEGTFGGVRPGGPDDGAREQTAGIRAQDIDATALERQTQAVAQDVMDVLRDLARSGAGSRDIDELRRLAADIRASDFSGNPEILAREARQALALAEQLELRLSRAVEGDPGGIRGTADEGVPEQHREIVADYYRRLGQTENDE